LLVAFNVCPVWFNLRNNIQTMRTILPILAAIFSFTAGDDLLEPVRLELGTALNFAPEVAGSTVFCYTGRGNTTSPLYLFREAILHVNELEGKPMPWYTVRGMSTDDDDTEGPEFSVKDVVDVMARLWAGINKPGGRARITKINYDPEEDEYTYNVSYVLGGTETKVERIYLNLVEDDSSSKRQRHIRGRCR
jgi:hypothetical protein